MEAPEKPPGAQPGYRLTVLADANRYGVEHCDMPRLILLHVLDDLRAKVAAGQDIPTARQKPPAAAAPDDAGETGPDDTPLEAQTDAAAEAQDD